MNAARFLAVLASCLFLAGCGARGSVDQSLAKAPPPVPRPRPDAPLAPDLRIPADTVASSARDIPLVPVPPVPIGRGAAPPALPAPPAAPAPLQPPVPGPPPVTAPTADDTSSAATAASPPAAGDAKLSSLRQLQQQAAAWSAGVDSYIVRLTRREQVNGTAKPEEIMMVKFRKEPWSVYFKWVGEVGHNREVLYVKGQNENKIHTRLATGDALLMPAGMRMALAVDSPMVRSASRHSITEAGIGACIDRLGALLDAQERGDATRGVLKDLGPQKRPEFAQPAPAAELTVPAGAEAELPNGGRRLFFFDPEHHLPMLVVTYDDKNQEVEYYHYDRLIAPGHLDADDFNPDKLWNSPKPAGKPQ